MEEKVKDPKGMVRPLAIRVEAIRVEGLGTIQNEILKRERKRKRLLLA